MRETFRLIKANTCNSFCCTMNERNTWKYFSSLNCIEKLLENVDVLNINMYPYCIDRIVMKGAVLKMKNKKSGNGSECPWIRNLYNLVKY